VDTDRSGGERRERLDDRAGDQTMSIGGGRAPTTETATGDGRTTATPGTDEAVVAVDALRLDVCARPAAARTSGWPGVPCSLN
jgi:hypothetical protein